MEVIRLPEELRELKPGQTVLVRISKNLEYKITHTGWVLEITSTQPIGIKPNGETSIEVVSLGIVEDDECNA